jgi:predicted nucleotidyltransferase
MESKLTKDDINNYLHEINDRLQAINKHGEILMAGGAVMTAVFNSRDSTRDIDAYFKPSEEIRKIVEDMANEHGLREDWLNDGVKGFITQEMGQKLYMELSNLSVYTIDAKGLLAMKLTSARYEGSDVDDSLFLMNALRIKDIEQLYQIVKKYTHENQQTVDSSIFIQYVFEEYRKQKQQ